MTNPLQNPCQGAPSTSVLAGSVVVASVFARQGRGAFSEWRPQVSEGRTKASLECIWQFGSMTRQHFLQLMSGCVCMLNLELAFRVSEYLPAARTSKRRLEARDPH